MRSVVHALLLSLGVWLACGVPAEAAVSAPPVDQANASATAMGVIVKFKDRGASAKTLASVIRLHPSDKPSDTAAQIRARVEALKIRHRLPYLRHKSTAFGAQLIHPEQPVPLGEAQAIAARLRADRDVAWAVPNEIVRPAATPVPVRSVVLSSDEGNHQPWLRDKAFNASRPAYPNIQPAWSRLASHGQQLDPVVVAVLDTGILPIPDLAGRVLQGWDFVSEVAYARDGGGNDADPRDEGDWVGSVHRTDAAHFPAECPDKNSDWHGTAIAYMLAAEQGLGLANGVGILAPLPGPVVLPVRVAGACGASTSDIIEGMLWAAGIDYNGSPARNAYPARVINVSLGGEGDCSNGTVHSVDWLYRETVARLALRGVLVVAAAGNGNGNDIASGAPVTGYARLTRPASCQGVLAVTALNAQGYKAVYANLADSTVRNGTVERGKTHALAAAGGDSSSGGAGVTSDGGIMTALDNGSTVPLGTYAPRALSGTSFAAPMVSGVAALMFAVKPGLTVDEVRNALSSVYTGASGSGALLAFPARPLASSVPLCHPTEQLRNCYCTTGTCGGGMLDADVAVAWAVGRLSNDPSSHQTTYANFSEFIPERMMPVPKKGGGGGGAADLGLLMALAGIGLGMHVARRRASLAGSTQPRLRRI